MSEKPQLVVATWVKGQPLAYKCSSCDQTFFCFRKTAAPRTGWKNFGQLSMSTCAKRMPRSRELIELETGRCLFASNPSCDDFGAGIVLAADGRAR